jgi:general secretion pathway protein A
MDALYQEYFGFREAPFNISPDPSFLYLSASHREALAQLSYGIRGRKGFIVLTGEVGTGKTTLIRALFNDLGSSTHTALIFNSIISPKDLMRYLCEEFGLVDIRQPTKEIHDYVVLLNEFLLEVYQRGENCALIIDEAQNLSAEVLESVRLLSNFETSKDKLLQILLVGQPELSERLNSTELRQLKQRVTLRYRLRNLTLAETSEYIDNRLQLAGGRSSIFTQKAVELMFTYSRGLPRIINVLSDNGLLTAYALGRHEVDASIIREVAEDLNLHVSSGSGARDDSQFLFSSESPFTSRTNGTNGVLPEKDNAPRTLLDRLRHAIGKSFASKPARSDTRSG